MTVTACSTEELGLVIYLSLNPVSINYMGSSTRASFIKLGYNQKNDFWFYICLIVITR